jgi:hypothetical protein
MYKLQGFLRIDNQQNNTVGAISNLGELSTQSMTYSREKGIYRNTTQPGIAFVSFTSKHENNPPVVVPQNYSDHILQVCSRMITYSSSFGDSVTSIALANDLFNNFSGLIFDFESGPLISTPNLTLPEWISWQNPLYNNGDNRIKIWLSDQAFRRQFDDYEIFLLNPVDDLKDLMRAVNITEQSLSFRNAERNMELIAQLKNNEPETTIRAHTYTFIHPLNASKVYKLTWHAIVYGRAGDNPDIVKDKIIEEIEAVENIDILTWKSALEELFSTTEFTLVPKWLNQAIPDRTIQAGIYSPITTVTQEINSMISLFSDVDPDFLKEHLQVIGVPYRSLSIYSLGGEDNLNGLYKLTQKYPDYINVGTESGDFNRMSNETQSFATDLQQLIMISENETDYAELPVYIRRVTRYGKTWLTRKFQGIQFLVYAKSNDVGN